MISIITAIFTKNQHERMVKETLPGDSDPTGESLHGPLISHIFFTKAFNETCDSI
jgi:hypothetical protein